MSSVQKTTENKRDHFTRSASIEQLRRFNTFICSQNYYILHAILCWLGTSKTVLQVTIKKCTDFVKTLLYGLLENKMRLSEDAGNVLFAASVYATIAAIFLQLAACLYVLSSVFLPAGLIFLFTCVYLISHLNFAVLLHTAKEKTQRRQSRRDCGTATAAAHTTKTIKPKQILGNRTISNVNLF